MANFDLAGGELNGKTTIESIEYSSGDIVVNIGTPTKEHYTFNGWVPPLNTIIEEDTTYVAQWTPVNYTFTFNLNGGNIGGSTTNKTTTGAYNTNSSTPGTPVRTHYTFNGWSPSVPSKFDGNKNFTAQWTPINYTFTFNLNGGNIGGSTTNKTTTGAYNTNSSTPGTPVRTHYTFAGWSPSLSSKFDGNKSFTAQWTPINYTFTFNLNGGNIGGSTTNKTTTGAYNTNSSTPGTPARTHYTFAGWSPSLPSKYDGNKTFTAQWTPINYTFTFNLNGGNISGSTTNKTTKGNNTQNVTTPGTPVRTHHTFAGWSPSLPSRYDGNKTFTAQWTMNNYTITYNLAGGTYSGSTANQTRSVLYNTMPPNLTPTRTGYVFLGWTPEISLTIKNQTYTAIWSLPMEIQMKKSAVNEGIFVPITLYSNGFALISNNGGSYIKYTTDKPTISNNVAANTAFTIKIAGRIKSFSYDRTEDSIKNQMYRLISWGELGAEEYRFSGRWPNSENTFGCKNLSGTIPTPVTNSFVNIKSFAYLFFDCESLTGTIPPTLFSNCPSVTNFENVFYDCISLTGSIPPNLFANCPNIKNFYRTFFNCKNLTGNAPALWNTYNPTRMLQCFDKCVKLSNYNSIPSDWK